MHGFWCACQPRSANLCRRGSAADLWRDMRRNPPNETRLPPFVGPSIECTPMFLPRCCSVAYFCFPFQLCLCVPTWTFFSLICGLPEFCDLCGAFFSMCTFRALVCSIFVLGCVPWLMWWALKSFPFSIPRSLVGRRSTVDVKGGCRIGLWGGWASQEGGLVDDC